MTTEKSTWQSHMESLERASTALKRAEDDVRSAFQQIREQDQYRLPINPEMVHACEKPWIIDMVTMYHEDKLNLLSMRRMMEEKAQAGELGHFLKEPDAKTLLALIEQVDKRLLDKMMDAVEKQMDRSQREIAVAQESRQMLKGYRDQVVQAYTLGLGNDYRPEWLGEYGHKAEPASPVDWKFADVGRKP